MKKLDYYILKDKYTEFQKIEDKNIREEKEDKIYDKLIEFISNKYYDVYLELDETFYDEKLMDIFATSNNEANFIERVIREYPIDIKSLIDEDYIIEWYIKDHI